MHNYLQQSYNSIALDFVIIFGKSKAKIETQINQKYLTKAHTQFDALSKTQNERFKVFSYQTIYLIWFEKCSRSRNFPFEQILNESLEVLRIYQQ